MLQVHLPKIHAIKSALKPLVLEKPTSELAKKITSLIYKEEAQIFSKRYLFKIQEKLTGAVLESEREFLYEYYKELRVIIEWTKSILHITELQ